LVLAMAVAACFAAMNSVQAAQPAATPTPAFKPSNAPPTSAPAPATKPSGATSPTPAPRAGGFPLELAFPMLAGGAAALGAGVFLVRRGKK
jgi:hypothetical protein